MAGEYLKSTESYVNNDYFQRQSSKEITRDHITENVGSLLKTEKETRIALAKPDKHDEEASLKAKVASRILTTLGTMNRKIALRKKLDRIFEEGCSYEEDDIITNTDNTSMNDNKAAKYSEKVLQSIACF
ncbi:hypothetical protein BD408DRAFT_431204 [Parasitella parasitica]|nr:hypothetical protein BD408DRAFT_431204 [Parasitella parasitica]